jgi:DNA-binding MarR family transcriptional regulator
MPQATIPQATLGPDTGAPEQKILQGLATIAQAVHQVKLHERILGAAGVRLDRAGASLLSKLSVCDTGSLRVTSLADRLGVDTPTVTRKVQQLERLGLVARTDDPEDRRAHRIRLTPAGRRAVARLTTARREWIDTLLAGWTSGDVERFSSLLGRFTDRLNNELETDRGN